MFIFDILLFLIVLGGIILIHEFGHFYFARRAGILVHEFAVGMGPIVYGKRGKDDVLYAIRAIPIGGYVSMAGEEVSDALIKKGQRIGLELNEEGLVKNIYVKAFDDQDIQGDVVSYDLYGKNQAALFITLKINDEEKTYDVLRTSKYILPKGQYMKVTPEEASFETKTLWQRFLTIFGGPLMNFVLAFGLYFIVAFFTLSPNLDTNEIGEVVDGYPASSIGIVSGDKITSINGNTVSTWDDLGLILDQLNAAYVDVDVLKSNGLTQSFDDVLLAVVIQTAGFSNVGADGSIQNQVAQTFGRAQEAGLDSNDTIYELIQGDYQVEVSTFADVIAFFREVNAGEIRVKYYDNGSDPREVTFDLISASALNRLGYDAFAFQFGITPTTSFNLGYSLLYPFQMIGNNVSQVFQTLGLLFSPGESIGVRDLSGPVGIFTLVSRTSSQGILAIISFTAFLSINIGILNLLPIPALDGGRLVFLGVEAVTKKKLSKKLENTINMAMFYLLLLLFVYVTYNDILRIIRGLI